MLLLCWPSPASNCPPNNKASPDGHATTETCPRGPGASSSSDCNVVVRPPDSHFHTPSASLLVQSARHRSFIYPTSPFTSTPFPPKINIPAFSEISLHMPCCSRAPGVATCNALPPTFPAAPTELEPATHSQHTTGTVTPTGALHRSFKKPSLPTPSIPRPPNSHSTSSPAAVLCSTVECPARDPGIAAGDAHVSAGVPGS